MTREEKTELLLCINIRVCLIETGNPVLRATDLQNQLRDASGEEKVRLARQVRALSSLQMKQILMLERLAEKITKAKTED
jgi:hypothetical protein